ncbi:MAG: hypothetical protein EXQ91_02090 [Alphaproteobacteria bacterium]|nr:hypothetical protein [Alphaproteobacteria bacterium]
MPVVFVATSKGLSEWAAEVGLSKNVYKLGIAGEKAEDELTEMNANAFAGQSDWKIVKKEKVDAIDEKTALEKVGRKERAVDPNYYPKIKRATGLFRVKIENVEKSIYVQQTLDGGDLNDVKIKSAEIAAYLIRNAIG